MRPALFLIAVLVAVSLAPARAATEKLALDTVIERFIDASGGIEAIRAIDNLVYRDGRYREGEFEHTGATMSRGRPFHKLVGDKNAPGDFMEGYDGSSWEWFADPGVVLRTVGAASEAARHYAGVEHPLVDYGAKGSRARLLGTVQLLGGHAAVIELVRRDGFTEQFYIDTASWLVVAAGSAAPIHAFGKSVQKLTRFEDHRRVAGVMIPFRSSTVELPSGRELWSMQWGTIEANRKLPADWFSPPAFARSPLQTLVEQLYTQRDDVEAALWTYDEYRSAYPASHTEAAIDFVGYQIVKMGQHGTALALLARNVADHPDSADARFGLGQALADAGRTQEADQAFRRALAIDPSHARARRALGAGETPAPAGAP